MDEGLLLSQHYITENIKRFYKRRLLMPALFLLIMAAAYFIFPINNTLSPTEIKQSASLAALDAKGVETIKVRVDKLYFTGYTSNLFNRANGYYYYTMWSDQCLLVLLSPSFCQEGIPTLEDVEITAIISRPGRSYQQIVTELSSDLNWTVKGLSEEMCSYYLNQTSATGYLTSIFLLVYFGCILYALAYLISTLVYFAFPIVSPPVRQLSKFGNSGKLLQQAEEELATLPQLATEDMFITEHFFIEIAQSGIAIVPISEIIWIYKHSTLHKFLWYHFVISDTLHIVGNKHFYLQCPRNIKSDIDGIMDYLIEANHGILFGFNEKNRLAVQEIQNNSLHFERVFDFLKKHI